MKMRKPLSYWLLAMAVMVAVPLFGGCGGSDSNPTAPVNRVPGVVTVTVNPQSVPAGGTATVMVSCIDPDGDALTYVYAPNQGSVTGTGPQVTWNAPTTAGNYSILVTVSDGKGGTNQGSGSLTVTGGGTGTTGIQGTVTLPPGMSGDIRNSRVAIYQSIFDLQNDNVIVAVGASGSESQVTFRFENLAPGTYYLDFWKDQNNNAIFDTGDVYGVHGTIQWPNIMPAPIMVVSGQMATATVVLILRP